MSWREYWNTDTPIYVNDRHKHVHCRYVAKDILRHVPGPDAHVLDHGCGEALAADKVAAGTGHLYLCDGAETVRARLRDRMGGRGDVTVLSPERVESIADGSLDLIVANSLLQYLSPHDLDALMQLWRRKLKPEGQLVLADVVPPNVGPLTDAVALLRFAAGHGFLVAAFAGLVRTFFSDYRKRRAELGLAQYTEQQMLAILRQHGYDGRRCETNFGHNQARLAFVAKPAGRRRAND